MQSLARRDFLALGLAAASARASLAAAADAGTDIHEQLLDLAARQEAQRRARFAAVDSKAGLDSLQATLRRAFLDGLGGLPEPVGVPPVHRAGVIEAEGYTVEKLAYESLPGYHVSALLYKPKKADQPRPAVLSPCGHSTIGKAEPTYQTLHVNLARRGYVVLTYDPVGQGERSQFWDPARGRSRFNLSCGEHAVLGNPLYLLGTNLARYRIWDGIRGLDYLASLPEVDPRRIGCVGNSGGGNLTAYIAALDSRVVAAAICCYITTLPRRMRNRIQEDPSADPEQDLFGFVSNGIDHAGLLALRVPRPTLLGTARFDFFPIEGARESFAEAKRLYELVGQADRIERVEAAERHGLTLPLRRAVYGWFDRWLAGRGDGGPADEAPFQSRPARELLVCPDGQVNLTYHSRPFLPLALEAFERDKKPTRPTPHSLRELLRLDPEHADPRITEVSAGAEARPVLIVCVNGNETGDWRDLSGALGELGRRGHAVVVVDPRGIGQNRPRLNIKGRAYADPLSGVEENIAYNAFLVGKSLQGMRVTDVLAAVETLVAKMKPSRVVLCGRRDAALTACLAVAVEPSIRQVATEEMILAFRGLFRAEGIAVNAAQVVPGLLLHFGDVRDVLAQIAPRKVLVAAGVGELPGPLPSTRVVPGRYSVDVSVLTEWLDG